MTVAYFDCFAGISGDMILGALIDLGLPLEVLERELKKLELGGYRLQVSRVNKLGVTATKFDVLLQERGGEQLADSQFQEVDSPSHGHGQTGGHDHGGTHQHDTTHRHDTGDQPADGLGHAHVHRPLAEILRLIRWSGLDAPVKELAASAFMRLGEAEAKVHGVPVESVHFHEVGGLDAIIDVVGSAIGMHYLGIDTVYASAVHLGQGMIKMAHGLYPIPGPATANLLAGVPVYQTEVRGELTTPTGAAVLTALAKSYGPMPPLCLTAVGYGAGTRDREIPNVLRVVLGNPQTHASAALTFGAAGTNLGPAPDQHLAPMLPAGYHLGQAVMIETNIDDMNPQVYDYLFERLTEAGALDVFLSPIQMKKNRPAVMLQVIARADWVDRALAVIFAETTTIGVRTYPITRMMLKRDLQTVQTEFGPIRVKVAWLGERVVNVKPEYDDCVAAAREVGVPLRQVEEKARLAFHGAAGDQA